MQVRVSGVWKDSKVSAKVAGVWEAMTYGYVRASGTWRKFYRKIDLFYNGTITMGAYSNGVYDYWGYSLNNYGSASSATLSTGVGFLLAQTGSETISGYTSRKWLQLGISGNRPTIDIPRVFCNGQESVAQIQAPLYVSAYDLTEIKFGFTSQLPISGTIPLIF